MKQYRNQHFFHTDLESEIVNALADRIAQNLDRDIMNSFSNSTDANHLINFSEQLNYREE